MLEAYFDESGTHDGSLIVAIGGFASHGDQWSRLIEEWQAVLGEFGMRCFHMTEFESGLGEFKGMRGDDKKKLLNKLLRIIGGRVETGIMGAVDVIAYNELFTRERQQRYGNAYAFCCQVPLIKATDWVSVKGYDEPVAFFFEAGAPRSREMVQMFRDALKDETQIRPPKGGTITLGGKIGPALQAADLLAYETYKEMVNRMEGNPRRTRYLLRELTDFYRIQMRTGWFDREGLQQFIVNTDRKRGSQAIKLT